MGKQPISGFEKRGDIYYYWPEDIILIGEDTKDGWEHPLYDPRVHDPVDYLLAADIAMDGGVQTAITVIKDGVTEGGKDRILCKVGRGRVKACRSLNETRLNMGMPKEFMVPCRFERKTSDRKALGQIISENEQRRQNTLENRVLLLERFLAAEGTIEEAAVRFRKSEETIRRYVKFMGVADEWKKVVYTGGGSMVDVLRLLSDGRGELLPHADQLRLYAEKSKAAAKARAKGQRPKKITDRLERGRPKGPSRRRIEHLIEVAKTDTEKFHPEFLRALQVVTGQISLEEAGLSELFKQQKKGAEK